MAWVSKATQSCLTWWHKTHGNWRDGCVTVTQCSKPDAEKRTQIWIFSSREINAAAITSTPVHGRKRICHWIRGVPGPEVMEHRSVHLYCISDVMLDIHTYSKRGKKAISLLYIHFCWALFPPHYPRFSVFVVLSDPNNRIKIHPLRALEQLMFRLMTVFTCM